MSFVDNNPVKYTDPTGHCIACAAVAVLSTPVGALLLSAAVIMLVHKALPGRDERNAAVANGIEQVVDATVKIPEKWKK